MACFWSFLASVSVITNLDETHSTVGQRLSAQVLQSDPSPSSSHQQSWYIFVLMLKMCRGGECLRLVVLDWEIQCHFCFPNIIVRE